MRNQWKSLLLRSITRRSSIHPSRIRLHHLEVRTPNPQNPCFSSFLIRNVHQSTTFPNPISPSSRRFSSESVLEDTYPKEPSDIISKSNSLEEIRKELESNNVKITYETVLKVLESLEKSPQICREFFDWVLETRGDKVSSKSYNLVLAALGMKDCVDEFWGLYEVMRKKGYRISKVAFTKASRRFEKEAMQSDLEKLKEAYAPDLNSIDRVCSRVVKVIGKNEWGDEVQRSVRGLNVNWSNDLVAMVVEHPVLAMKPMKALMFFWWVEEEPSFKHGALSYNAMVRVLGREDCIEKFWRVVEEMKAAGCEMEMGTYVKVIGRFFKRGMLKDAVDLYEVMMRVGNKPEVQEVLFLLQKIVVAEELDMDLFSRVVKIFSESGNALTDSILIGVIKSLNSVGRLQKYGTILKAMEEGGFVPTNDVYNDLAIRLCNAGRVHEAVQIIDGMVNGKKLRPHRVTFKMLIEKLLDKKSMKEALRLIGWMKDQGFPPYVDPFINHISKCGSGDDAISFMKEMTVKSFPATSVCIRMLEGFLTAGRHNEAHNCLAKCPDNIRNHADVLNLFSSMTPKEAPDQIAASA